MNDYDVGKIFQEIEFELIKSMKRNLESHEKWEKEEGFEWEQWQAKKIRELRKFKAQNKAIMANYSRKLDRATKGDLKRQYLEGGKRVDKEVSKAVKKGFSLTRGTPSDDFFQGGSKRLNSLVNAINNDFKQAQNAALRQMDDVYRRTIFKAETYLNTGASTLDQAIDMATKDFLAKGIDCITYSDGRKVNIASYAQMAVRTANRRVHLMGEGERRKEWGLSLVLVSQYLQSSPTCQPWQGRVYIDDVYSGGKIEDGDYPLLSQAIAGNLFHPNCRHSMSTFFEDINAEPEPMYKDESDGYKTAKREAEINRNIQKYTRLKAGSLDPANIKKYDLKIKEWESKLKSIESEKASRKTDTSNIVAWDNINSKEYRDKFAGITNKPEMDGALHRKAIDILKRKSNTDFEELHLIDDKGKVVASQTHSTNPLEVEYNDALRNAIRRHAEYSLVSIHNHPRNTPPSGSNFVSNGQRKYALGVIVCHNGDVYVYRAGKKPFTQTHFDKIVEKHKKLGYNEKEAYIKTLQQFEEDYGIKWEER